MITVSPQVIKLFFSLVQPPQGAQIYSNNLDSWKDSLDLLAQQGLLAAGLTTSSATQMEIEHKYPSTVRSLRTGTPSFYQPKDTYHYGFAAFDFDEHQQPIPVQDKLFHWKASEYYLDRKAPAHLIGLEGLLYATLTGGYFATVLPKHWLGTRMQFRRWWENNCATVARIPLPEGCVKYVDDRFDGCPPMKFYVPKSLHPGTPMYDEVHKDSGEITHESLAQQWSLVIFQRPAFFGDKNQRTAAFKQQLKKS